MDFADCFFIKCNKCGYPIQTKRKLKRIFDAIEVAVKKENYPIMVEEVVFGFLNVQ